MKWTPLKVSLLFVITLSQIMLLAGFLSYKNLNIVLGSWNQSAHLSVYLKTDTTEEERNQIAAKIRNDKYVTDIEYIDRTKASEEFRKSFGNYSAGILTTDELVDLIPESLVVSLSDQLSLNKKLDVFKNIIHLTANLAGVDEVSYGGDWLSKFSQLDGTLKSVGLFILAVVLLSVSFLSALMVRILIDDAKAELEVYTLLGATRWFMYRIFFKEILAFLILSLSLSFVGLFALFTYFKNFFLVKNIGFGFVDRLTFLSTAEVLSFCAIAATFIFLSSFISLKTAIQRLNQFSYE